MKAHLGWIMKKSNSFKKGWKTWIWRRPRKLQRQNFWRWARSWMIYCWNRRFFGYRDDEGKLYKLWNKAQQAQWAHWRVQNVHTHMTNEGRAHPFAWAPGRDEGPDLPITFQGTCSTSKRGLSSKSERLVQQVWVTSSAGLWGLLCKERRQDLTTIKRPLHPQKRYA